MKKTIITLLAALLLLPATVSAQYWMIINNSENSKKDSVMIWDISSVSFSAIDSEKLPDGGASPLSVNLGLSVEWANMNLGATSPQESGWLVGWGDVTAKNVSTNPKWYPVENPTSDIVGFSNDIIKRYWGATTDSPWRLPTDEEWQELIDNCVWSWDPITNCIVVTGNGNFIYLPAAGYREGENPKVDANYYWSGTLNTTDRSTAKALSVLINGETVTRTLADVKRFMGCALRAVNGVPKINVSISAGAAYNVGKNSAQIDVQLSGAFANYSNLEYGIFYSTNNDLNVESTRQKVAETSVGSSGVHTFALSGLSTDVAYYYIPYVKVNESYIYGQETLSFFTTAFPEPEAVDMGLSVKWASYNVGASSPTEYGNYIGWGDATGTMTATNTGSYAVGNTSMIICGNKDYDVAQAKWGKKWRLPRRSEFYELLDQSKCSATVENGCYKFTSLKTGNSIYIPKAGGISSSGAAAVGTSAFYWSGECSTATAAYEIHFINEQDIQIDIIPYSVRFPIRAVYADDDNSSNTGGDNTGGDNTGGDNTGGDNTGGDNTGGNSQETETPVAGNAVNLGLSVKWADRNVGALGEAYYGDYFTWGATEEQNSYGTTDYVHYLQGSPGNMKCLGSVENETNKTAYSIASTGYDVAHVSWGGTWRMPSEAEIGELIEKCTWTWSSRKANNGNVIQGYEITRAGYSGVLFMPAAGYKTGDSSPYSIGNEGYYWTADLWDKNLETFFNKRAYYLFFSHSNGEKSSSYGDRARGLSIRPVK